jgi:ribosomal protein L29
MTNQLENQIRELKKELAEIKKNQALLRLQPCLGDLEIREKDEKMGELDGRATVINETVRDLTRKHQLFLSESAPRTTYDVPRSNRGS